MTYEEQALNLAGESLRTGLAPYLIAPASTEMILTRAGEILAGADAETALCDTCGHPLNGTDKIPAPYAPEGCGITQADYDHAWNQTH